MSGNAFSLNVNTRAIDDMLAKLGAEVSQSLRPAAQAAAQIISDQVELNVPQSASGHWFHGTHQKYWFDAGTLRKAIYQVFSKDNSDAHQATYHIAWNHREAPYGFMVEYGTSRAPAHPFLGPAVSKFPEAVAAAQEKLMDELLRRGAVQ